MFSFGRADKQDLREELLQERRALLPEAIEAARAAVCAAVLERAGAAGWTAVAAYLPLRTEPGSPELLDGLVRRGLRVLVPVTLPDHDLDWVQLPGDVPLGRDAIAGVDALLVPALAVGADGTRLGRGGGSYDRALARVPAGVPIAALLYDGELLAHVPSQAWDLPVTATVRPSYGWQDL
ncbi:MAG TPA: 5-formyltetrahydrofolate cyclo-ligase [Jatrophihabitans sp.]